MKKIVLIAFATAITLAGCKKEGQFSLSSTSLPDEMNGKYIYIYDQTDTDVQDSILVANNGFKYESEVDTTKLYGLLVGNEMYPFIKEPKALSLVKKEEADMESDTRQYTITGSVLTARYYQYTKEVGDIYVALKDQYDAVLKNDSLDDDAKSAKLSELNKKQSQQQNVVNRKYYEENKGNAIGAYAFSAINFDSDEEFITEYEKGSKAVQDNKLLKERYVLLKNAAETQVGSDYKEFTMKDENGNEKKFSDYIGNDKYLLVDFWASWCVPCRRAIPHLAELEKQYAAKGLRLLSIGTSDEPEKNAQAISDLNITWETFLDTESVGADTYGITAIPTLLLFSPDGKILVRTHIPDDIDNKLQEIFK